MSRTCVVFLWCFSRRVALSRWVASLCVALLWPRHRVDGVPVSFGLGRRLGRGLRRALEAREAPPRPGRSLEAQRALAASRPRRRRPAPRRRRDALDVCLLSRRRPRERRGAAPTPSTRIIKKDAAQYRNVDVVQ